MVRVFAVGFGLCTFGPRAIIEGFRTNGLLLVGVWHELTGPRGFRLRLHRAR